VEKQLAFGSRVPGTTAHQACGDYLAAKLTEFGAQVTEQKADITHYDGKNLTLRNIIGSYYPERRKEFYFLPIGIRGPLPIRIGCRQATTTYCRCDDGASGVGTLLEIARNLQQYPVEVGVDIIFFDLEDWGQPSFDTDWVQGEWWCLGSRYWSEQPHVENYKADYGILLDMVGAANATFLKEGYSMKYAPNILDKVWSTAAKLGHGNYFLHRTGGISPMIICR
jgi:hypothetical protein